MFNISIRLLFACLLLLSQTALVSHDVQHLGSAHNELCAVYVSQDHSAHSVTVSVPPIFYVSSAGFQGEAIDLLAHGSNSVYRSRAPPTTIFFS